MGENPLVSILTPTLNSEKYLPDLIQSIKRQTYSNIEHVFVDAASTDGTLGLIEEYAREANVRWISEPDRGTSDACNKAADLAEGDIIVFISIEHIFVDGGSTDSTRQLVAEYAKTHNVQWIVLNWSQTRLTPVSRSSKTS